MIKKSELTKRIAEMEAEVASLVPYRERLNFIEHNGIDVICAPSGEGLPPLFQLQKRIENSSGKEEFAVLSMDVSLVKAIDTAILKHAKPASDAT